MGSSSQRISLRLYSSSFDFWNCFSWNKKDFKLNLNQNKNLNKITIKKTPPQFKELKIALGVHTICTKN